MGRARKAVLLLFDLLLLIVCTTVVLIYFQISNWSIDGTSIQTFLLTNRYFALFIFWVALVLIITLIVSGIVVLFYPKSSNNLELKNDKGSLQLNKKAIEGFIQSSLNQTDFIHAPKVTVKMFKKTIKVSVTGDVKRTSELIDKQAIWAKDIEHNLKKLLGLNQDVAIHVKLVNTSESSKVGTNSTKSTRVQ